MKKKLLILSVFLLSSGVLFSNEKCCKFNDNDSSKDDKPSKTGVIGPRWTYGIMVKNASDKEIRVMVDGGDVNGYIAIPAGQEKLLNSKGEGKRVYWKSGDFEYETAKYGKPDNIVIKNGNIYDMQSFDGTKNMGTWTALEKVEYLNQEAKAKKAK